MIHPLFVVFSDISSAYIGTTFCTFLGACCLLRSRSSTSASTEVVSVKCKYWYWKFLQKLFSDNCYQICSISIGLSQSLCIIDRRYLVLGEVPTSTRRYFIYGIIICR